MSNTVTQETMLTLHLPLSVVNTVLKGLGELPLKESRQPSAMIEAQANAELARQQEFLAKGAAPQTPAPASEASQGAGAQEDHKIG